MPGEVLVLSGVDMPDDLLKLRLQSGAGVHFATAVIPDRCADMVVLSAHGEVHDREHAVDFYDFPRSVILTNRLLYAIQERTKAHNFIVSSCFGGAVLPRLRDFVGGTAFLISGSSKYPLTQDEQDIHNIHDVRYYKEHLEADLCTLFARRICRSPETVVYAEVLLNGNLFALKAAVPKTAKEIAGLATPEDFNVYIQDRLKSWNSSARSWEPVSGEMDFHPLIHRIRAIEKITRDYVSSPEQLAAYRNEALLNAIIRNKRDRVAALLDAGADVNAPSEDGSTPLHVACQEGEVAIMGLLLERGAKLKDKSYSFTPLMFAAFEGKGAAVEWLLAQPEVDLAYLRQTGSRKKTEAFCKQHNYPVDWRDREFFGKTAAEIARCKRHIKVAEQIEQRILQLKETASFVERLRAAAPFGACVGRV